MIGALLTAAALAASAPEPDALIREATQLMLDGQDLPADMDKRLMTLSPADRMEVLVFLRRSGMMTGPEWTAERLLAPAQGNDR